MDFSFELNALRQTRANLLKLVEGLTTEQLNHIPSRFNNNLAWHLGHVVVTQQLLCYKLSGLELAIDPVWIDMFRKGTSPHTPYAGSLHKALKAAALVSVDVFERDLEAGMFQKFSRYPTSFGVTLNSIEDAILFNNVHEGVHYGYVLAMRKILG